MARLSTLQWALIVSIGTHGGLLAFRIADPHRFERTFKEFGLPQAIRTDNGVPFASPNGLFGLSKLSVWWLRLGIEIERIRPGHPEQNGRHERMHLTLKKEATRPPGLNSLQQQAASMTLCTSSIPRGHTRPST